MWGKIWGGIKWAAQAIFVLNREDIIDINEAPVIKGEIDRADAIIEAEKARQAAGETPAE